MRGEVAREFEIPERIDILTWELYSGLVAAELSRRVTRCCADGHLRADLLKNQRRVRDARKQLLVLGGKWDGLSLPGERPSRVDLARD